MTTPDTTPGRRRRRTTPTAALAAALAAAALAATALPAAPASAHTGSSLVAVPAGSDATVTFRPEHGCGDSPTVGVRIQAPVPDARPGDVDGWTSTARPDGAGNTVVEWTGGLVPADEAGAFPIELTVPDTVGTLLAFPAIQRCENGEELAWIGVMPGDPHPAPQVLVLPAGARPAATLDDVPLDAPGREQLVALAEGATDAEDATAPTTTAGTPATVTSPPTSVAPTTSAEPAATAPTTAAATVTATTDPAADDGGSSTGVVVAVVLAVIVVSGAVAAIVIPPPRRDVTVSGPGRGRRRR